MTHRFKINLGVALALLVRLLRKRNSCVGETLTYTKRY